MHWMYINFLKLIFYEYLLHIEKNEYILQRPGTDKHKYGYELKENKHFHHTTTEEDGVRCEKY